MAKSEQLQTVISLAKELIITAVIILLLVTLMILWQISKISREIRRVQRFASKLSEGDLTVDALESKKKDELGTMAHALDEMYDSNKNMIGKISDYAHTLESESENLGKAAKEFADQFAHIENLLRNVNDDMASTSAATEEVNASVEEANSTIMILAEETVKSTALANEIKERASEIEKNSQKSFEQTKLLSREHEEKLNESIGHADVVKSIGEMAEVITGIAGQINMLSLNASIEAARAGEMGRGFAVVAEEIGKLAGETSLAANEIKGTITQVQETFDGLVKNSGAMLSFVKDNITPDYDTFVSVAKQYEQDAVEIETFSREIGKMTEGIERIISEVANAIQSIAESSQNTVENGNNIINSIELASDLIGQVDEMATEQGEISKDLTNVVRGFKIQK
jgi:methyl-accepting chemotaxis protein